MDLHVLVPIIIIMIICGQIYVYLKNRKRMNMFRDIFSQNLTWELTRNTTTDIVNGIDGEGNEIFSSIRDSINKYLGFNQGSVIDFGLLKDAVDRHCDSVENEIASQTPVPLYLGLAGTMVGVIIGLFGLNLDFITSTDATNNAIASGVEPLLDGVAWAMMASICGIALTTINTFTFKKCKLAEENGKNSFLAWMQSKLLPELPTDTAQALNNMVKNLNEFNRTFADNTANLGNALAAVNESYATQAEVIKAVQQMDVMSMANANVTVLRELQHCTEKLEQFNQYLTDIQGYTDAIHRFEEMFREDSDNYGILREMRDFFRDYNGAIAKTTADADDTLKSAMKGIKETTSSGVDEMIRQFDKMNEKFKSFIANETEQFEQLSRELREKFSERMKEVPQLAKRLDEISDIPAKLDKLIERIDQSNKALAKALRRGTSGTPSGQGKVQKADVNNTDEDNSGGSDDGNKKWDWKPWAIGGGAGVVLTAAVFGILAGIGTFSKSAADSDTTTDTVEVVTEAAVAVEKAAQEDTTKPDTTAHAAQPQIQANTTQNNPGN